LIAPTPARKINHIVTVASLISTLRRSLVALLLVAVALAPAVSRAHLRFSTHPSPAQDNARFKWSNSCERVPSRLADEGVPAVPAVPVVIEAERSPRHNPWLEADIVQVAPAFVSPPALRAPPSLFS
jgi:hypothetical protein